MPTVGKRKFAYTPKGEAAAKKYAKQTGQKLKVMSSAQDARMDKKAGIKEGSARDNRLDRKRGVPVRRGR